MGPIAQCMQPNNKIAEAPKDAGEDGQENVDFDEIDPNELEFNPATDLFLEDSNQILMSKCKLILFVT